MPVKMTEVTASLTKGEGNRIKPVLWRFGSEWSEPQSYEALRREELTKILNVPEVLSTRDEFRRGPWRPAGPAFEGWFARLSAEGEIHHFGVIWPGICTECAVGRDPAMGSSQACPGMGLAPFVVAFFAVLCRDGA